MYKIDNQQGPIYICIYIHTESLSDSSVQSHSRVRLCDPMNRSTPGLPVHHQLNGHEFEQAPGVGAGQGGLACYGSWGRRVGHDCATELN